MVDLCLQTLLSHMGISKIKKSEVLATKNFSRNVEHEIKVGFHRVRWKKGETFEGQWVRNSFHGDGTYKWNKLGTYEGSFYSNFKEGYAVLSLPDNSYFEGLFIRNQPFGPGVLTHANGRQDAGFWLGSKLMRLSRSVDFIVPRLAPTFSAKKKLLHFCPLIPLDEKPLDSVTNLLKDRDYSFEGLYSPFSDFVYDNRSIFYDQADFEKVCFEREKNFVYNIKDKFSIGSEEDVKYQSDNEQEKRSELDFNRCLCSDSLLLGKFEEGKKTDVCEEKIGARGSKMGLLAYLTKYGKLTNGVDTTTDLEKNETFEENGEESQQRDFFPTKIFSWNQSELCTEMMKQIFRHRTFEDKVNLKIANLIFGARTAFRRTGEKEKQCLQFLKMCSMGPAYVVKELLCSYEISEELMDSRGNSGLMFAAATDKHEVVDVLLDYGFDVNTFNDENLTPLNLCLLRRLAQSNDVSNWETAFLPDKVSEIPEINLGEWNESIASLDRIFGDGWSLNSSYGSDEEHETLEGQTSEKSWQQLSFLENRVNDLSTGSHVTIMKLKKVQASNNSSRNLGANEVSAVPLSLAETPKIKTKIVPKSYKRREFEQSIWRSSRDRYLFELCVGSSTSVRIEKGASKAAKGDERARWDTKEEKTDSNSNLVAKIKEIDKTIEKLLKRGANPDISEVPKPSIHLGVFTKDVNLVHLLLTYGACPDHHLFPSEGLLTPLHLVTLLKPEKEYVDICRLLHRFGANPEKETSPEFRINDDESSLLDPMRGRTPLQLLCMRPDLEAADPQKFFIKMALFLAQVSDRRKHYNGHSYLTLAMSTGNISLLRALLRSKLFNPNEVLENDLGTALHVLVSTPFQTKTMFENSVKMCDLLIDAGANALTEIKSPPKMVGTCIDYGYREINAEIERRKIRSGSKTDTKVFKLEKNVRDHLTDHVKLVDYLIKRSKFGKSRKTPQSLLAVKNHTDLIPEDESLVNSNGWN